MKKVAVVGAGVAGLTVANLLRDRYDVTVFEKDFTPGGLIRCQRIDGSLFHICGGHVFNTKNKRVDDWFWAKLNKDRDFVKAERNAAIHINNQFVDYPIENHVYQLGNKVLSEFYADIAEIIKHSCHEYDSFGDFLIKRFGKTLFDLYFNPYNTKIWRCDLNSVPMAWMEGKLPMPRPEEMVVANEQKLEEKTFVHSSFYYPKLGGSQFIADKLAVGLNIRYGVDVMSIAPHKVNGEYFDKIVFCGNIKNLPRALSGIDIGGLRERIRKLGSHGTTSVLCECEHNPYSWIYQPSNQHDSHRIICTGNFSATNNAIGKMTCVVEFTDQIDIEEIKLQLKFMPYHPHYVTHHYSQYSYPIQSHETREVVLALKAKLSEYDISLCGRFAEWEYFNMDAVMDSAINLSV